MTTNMRVFKHDDRAGDEFERFFLSFAACDIVLIDFSSNAVFVFFYLS